MAETEGSLVPQTTKYEQLEEFLISKRIQLQLRAALPSQLSPERLARFALTQIKNIPKLLECSGESIYGAIIEAAQLGLEIGSRGQCWLIPFKGKATLVIGYRGMLDLAWRSQMIRSVFAKEVYAADHIGWEYGTEAILTHRQAPVSERVGNPTHAYATLDIVNGGKMFDVMQIEEIEAIRARSRQKDSGPWVNDYPEMCKKTVLRRLLKLAPCSSELGRAVTLDEQAEYGLPQELPEPRDVTPEPEPSEGSLQMRLRLLSEFAALGVDSKMIENYLKKDIEQITDEEVAELRGILNAINDKERTVGEIFGFEDRSEADDAGGAPAPEQNATEGSADRIATAGGARSGGSRTSPDAKPKPDQDKQAAPSKKGDAEKPADDGDAEQGSLIP